MRKSRYSEKGGKNRGGKVQRSMFQTSCLTIVFYHFIRNVKLLSFGADEEAGEEEESTFKKKPIFRPERMPSYISVNAVIDIS